MKIRFTFLVSLLVTLCATVSLDAVAASDCPQFSPGGRAPIVANAKMRVSTQQLCYSDFAVLHSGVTHGPLWSAEHLTAEHMDDARDNTRTNRFFVDKKLPPGDSATLSDYKKSGYDRGLKRRPPKNVLNLIQLDFY